MLAYVFWHWPQSSIDRTVYESDLLQFHQTLAANKPAGFRFSVVYSMVGARWLPTTTSVYEEWYLLDDSAAMDRINYAAVNGPCEEPHNRVARNADGGVGGLYRLRLGQENLIKDKHATWLSKPPGMSYSAFDAKIQSVISNQAATLWARQMTLGPTTEFCLHSETPLKLPAEFSGTTISLTTLK